jgi:formate transporter
MMSTMFGFDAYSPKEISERIETLGVSKGRLPLLSILVLGVLAGAFYRPGRARVFFSPNNS